MWFECFRACARNSGGNLGGSERKWAEHVKLSTWFHDVHLEDGAEMKHVAPRSNSCKQSQAMQFLRAEHAYVGFRARRMDEGRSGATRMRWERMCAIIPWLTGMHEESERTERESVRATVRASVACGAPALP